MKFRRKILLLLPVLLIIICFHYYFISSKIKDETIKVPDKPVIDQSSELVEYESFSSTLFDYTFDYPDNWSVETNRSESLNKKENHLFLTSNDQSFSLSLSLIKQSIDPNAPDLCAIKQDCGGVTPGNYGLPFDKNDFQVLTSYMGKEIIVADTGVVGSSSNHEGNLLVSQNQYDGSSQKLYQIRDDELYDMVKFSETPTSVANLNAYYSFDTKDGFDNWEQYKEIMIMIIDSIQDKSL